MKEKLKLHGRLRVYLSWPFWLGLIMLMMEGQLFIYSKRAGIIGLAYVLVFLMCAFLIRFIGHRKLQKDLVEFASNYGQMQMKLMKELTVPFAILSSQGQLLWGNDKFVSIGVSKKAARKNISNVFPEITQAIFPKDETPREIMVEINDHAYRSVLKVVSDNGFSVDNREMPMDQLMDTGALIALFLYDETELVQLEEKRVAENLVVGLIYIDNYDEMLDNIDEVRQSLMLALIDRKINKMMLSIDAISKKLEKDKFLFVFKQSYLNDLIEQRFPLLEDIRSTTVGNEQGGASISMGIGVGKGSFAERYEFARAGIDLALGRGGDQAVLKSQEGEQFFGGKRVQVERNTRVKARVKAQALKELIESKENVLVMGHTLGDADSFGAAIGIYRIAKTLEHKVNIVINKVNSSVNPMMERFYGADYENDMFIDSETALSYVNENTVVVVVDVNTAERTECPELIEMAQFIVVIDHHRQAALSIDQAVLFYIEPYASSACEMVTEISQYIGNGLKLRSIEAEAMYSGIMIDTNYFTDKTGVRTFEAMAYLRRNGVDSVRVRKMFRGNLQEIQARAASIQNAQIYRGQFALSECDGRGIEEPTVLAAKIANTLLDINGVAATFVFTRYNGRVYISARSMDDVNVQVIMERIGGGGHLNMAGTQLMGLDVEGAMEQVKQIIDEMIEEGEIKDGSDIVG